MTLSIADIHQGMLASSEEASSSQQLAGKMAHFLYRAGFGREEALKTLISPILAGLSDAELRELKVRSEQRVDWGLRKKDPIIERICDAILPEIFTERSKILGSDNLRSIKPGKAIVFLGNHQSAIDVHLLHSALKQCEMPEVASNITAVVGYKTFEYGFLRQMSLCFDTLKVPQSLDVSNRSREIGARAVAKLSGQIIEIAKSQLQAGKPLIIFPEGTRTRTGKLLPLLPAISRYVRDLEDAVIIPWSVQGADKMIPVDKFELTPADVCVSFGKPIDVKMLRGLTMGANSSKVMMDVVGFLIADLLPEAVRGFYSRQGIGIDKLRARSIADSLQ